MKKIKEVFARFWVFCKKHPVISMMLLLLLCWMPYVLIFYPGPQNPDSLLEIWQFQGREQWTTHHPILPTIIYGGLVEFATSVLKLPPNFGLFLSNIIQIIIAAWILSYSINYIYGLTRSKWFLILVLAFFIFIPIWPINFYTQIKDIYYTLFLLLFIIISIKFFIGKGKITKKEWILYICSMILVYLFRNNGIFILIFSVPFLMIGIANKEKLKILGAAVFSIIFCFAFNNICKNTLNIEDGSIREALSMPIQQVARYATKYELTEEEAAKIGQVIDIDEMVTKYNPEISDPVKNNFKYDPNKNDLIDFFTVWWQLFCKHPLTYLEATINSVYGYFYPSRAWFYNQPAYFTIPPEALDNAADLNSGFHLRDQTALQRIIVLRIIFLMRDLPVVGLLLSCGFYNWIVIGITVVAIYFRKYKELIILVPIYISSIVCILSPVDAYLRYMLPIMILLPFVVTFMTSRILARKKKR